MENNLPNFEPYEGKEPYMFVSYSRGDQDLVIKDLNSLHRLGFRIWYDRGIGAGDEWEKSIQEHLDNCNCRLFVIFLSTNSLKSGPVHDEITLAKARKHKDELKIFPVLIEGKIDETNRDYKFLKEINGITRPNEPNGIYYSRLVSLLEIKLPNWNCRDDPRDRDSKILGLGSLPTNKEVFVKLNLTPEVIEERRKKYVRDMGDDETSYKIDNIFQLTSPKTKALENLAGIPFASTTESPSNLVTLPLDIGETYIAPLRLISGLITRLEENWPPLVRSYGNLVHQGKKDLLDDLHYFIEFCWLAWGPSVLTTSDSSTEEFVVLQAAYGDEANSLPLIMKRTLWQPIEDRLSKTPNSYSGWPVSLKNVLLVRPGKDDFFSAVRDYPLFEDMFSGEEGEDTVALYLPDGNDGYGCGGIELLDKHVAQNESNEPDSFYSTAYVWLMLEQVDKEAFKTGDAFTEDGFKPGKVLPFFEHANLATRKGLNFLSHCLVRKAIYHALECEAEISYQKEGYYRFATALFPEQILAILKHEIDQLTEPQQDILKKRLIIPDDLKSMRTPLDVVKFADAVNQSIKDSLLIDSI